VIIRETNEYPMLTQAKIVSACGVIQNFIGTYDPDDQPEPWSSEEVFSSSDQASGSLGSGTIGGPEIHRASMKRGTLLKPCGLATKRSWRSEDRFKNHLEMLCRPDHR